MKNNRLRVVLSILMAAIVLLATGCSEVPGNGDPRPRVLATNFALYDIARAVCGVVCDVRMVISPGTDSHDMEVTASDIALVASSDVFIYAGGESDEWVKDVMSALGDAADGITVVRAADFTCLLPEEDGRITVKEEEDEEEDGEGFDEHVWTSVPNLLKILDAVADSVDSAVPGHSAEFSANAEDYAERLREADRHIRDMLENAESRLIIVADRFPFRYFAEEYGLEYYAAFSGCTSNTEPTLSSVNTLKTLVEENGIRTVFIIELSDGKTARVLADSLGVGIMTLYSGHNVTKEDFESGVTYAELIERNTEALRTALSGRSENESY